MDQNFDRGTIDIIFCGCFSRLNKPVCMRLYSRKNSVTKQVFLTVKTFVIVFLLKQPGANGRQHKTKIKYQKQSVPMFGV